MTRSRKRERKRGRPSEPSPDGIVPAYATIILKSQGSNYPVVAIPGAMEHVLVPHRDLAGTSITQGKRLVVLVGEVQACAVAELDPNP